MPADVSLSSLNSIFYDEGYSNKFESVEQERKVREELEATEMTDAVFETGVRRAVGMVNGTDSSKSIERLMGAFNKQRGVSKLKCPVGDESIVVKFDPNCKVESDDGQGEQVQDESEQVQAEPRGGAGDNNEAASHVVVDGMNDSETSAEQKD